MKQELEGKGEYITLNFGNRGIWHTEYINDRRIIQYVAMLHGYDITLLNAEDIWESYSDKVSASWLMWNMKDLDGIWDCIKDYFINLYAKELKDDEYYDYKYDYSQEEYQIDFVITRKE